MRQQTRQGLIARGLSLLRRAEVPQASPDRDEALLPHLPDEADIILDNEDAWPALRYIFVGQSSSERVEDTSPRGGGSGALPH
jgi:hypothetical protein